MTKKSEDRVKDGQKSGIEPEPLTYFEWCLSLFEFMNQERIRVFLETLLVVFALIMALVLSVMYAFGYDDLVAADKRFLENIVLGRNVSDAELETYYSAGALRPAKTPSGFYYKYSQLLRRTVSPYLWPREGGQDAYGPWPKCFLDDAYSDSNYPACTLPSYRLFFFTNSANSYLIGSTLSLAVLYVLVLLFGSFVEDKKSQQILSVVIK